MQDKDIGIDDQQAPENEYLETHAPIDNDLEANKNNDDEEDEDAKEADVDENGIKKKRTRRKRRHVSRNKFSARKKKPPSERKKRDHRQPDELYYFSRVWRDIGNKWWEYCDEDIYNGQEFWRCNMNHILHLDCSTVKWVGRKTCPLCVEPPKKRPKDLLLRESKRTPIPEEVSEEIEDEGPMKPNQV